MSKKAIITGIAGQDGSYLARLLLSKGYDVIGITLENVSLYGLDYLQVLDSVKLEFIDLNDFGKAKSIIEKYKPEEIYHLAAQSSVGESFKYPGITLRNNMNSTINILDGIMSVDKPIKLFNASSNEIFGNSKNLPTKIDSQINPLSPYGLSKAFGHMTVENYRRIYNIFAVSGVLYNHESYLRTETFFVKKVICQSIEISKGIREELRVGNIDIKRDFGYAPDYVEAMWLMLQTDKPKDYIICSGQSIYLREIIEYIFKRLSISTVKIISDKSLYRSEDIIDAYGDNSIIKRELGWNYRKTFYDVLETLLDEELLNY